MYISKIMTSETGFFALIVRVDRDGDEQVDACFRPRHFTTKRAALKATRKYLLKMGAVKV